MTAKTTTATFTATGNGAYQLFQGKKEYTYEVSGTFVGTWILEKTKDHISHTQVATGTGTASETTIQIPHDDDQFFLRFRCSAFTSGTITATVSTVDETVIKRVDDLGNVIYEEGTETQKTSRREITLVLASGAKVGGTAGINVDAANDKGSLLKCPASQTAATAVVKIPHLQVGDIITSFGVNGQLESAGNTATVDAALRRQTVAAGDNTDAEVGAITQISKTADYAIADSVASLSETVAADEGFYALITITTAASTDVDLLNVTLGITRVN